MKPLASPSTAAANSLAETSTEPLSWRTERAVGSLAGVARWQVRKVSSGGGWHGGG